MVPPGGEGRDADHTAEVFQWNIFLLGGNPKEEGSGAEYHPATDVCVRVSERSRPAGMAGLLRR